MQVCLKTNSLQILLGCVLGLVEVLSLRVYGDLMATEIKVKRKAGNPNWGRPMPPIRPNEPTAFEQQLEMLGLSLSDCVDSAELKRWCRANKSELYVPEWLLSKWDMQVGFDRD
jgi:hypothetical protein